MRMCSKCKEVKEETEFSFKSRAKNKLHVWCKSCHKVYKDQHYKDNKTEYVRRSGVRNRRIRDELIIRLIEYVKTHPCVDCGESDYVVLQFDHVRGQKTDSVSQMIGHGYSWLKVLAEIEKCQVRCANCHMRKTATQLGWYKNLKLSPNWSNKHSTGV